MVIHLLRHSCWWRKNGRIIEYFSCRRMCENTSPNSTVGIIVIGDEILKGHTQDTNSYFLCKRLFSLGAKVKRISTIPDELDVIADEVVKFSGQYTHVITSGGIGPTHDDRTIEGVAKAFGEELEPHPELVALCKEFFKTDDMTSPKMKMAFVPKSSRLHYGVDKTTGKKNVYPLICVKNVYIFPGVPSIMEKAFSMLEELFQDPHAQIYHRDVYINRDEFKLAEIFNKVEAKFRDSVMFGSYPEFYNSYYKVKLTMESQSAASLKESYNYLTQLLPEGSEVQFDSDPIGNAAAQVYKLAESQDDPQFAQHVINAIKIIEESFERYSLSDICVGFNGGKDCTALLHLFYAVVKKHYPDYAGHITALYIRSKLPFPEVELFMQKSVQRYSLNLLRFHGRIKDSLFEMQKQQPSLKAVMMGTRRTDPYSESMESFKICDSDWPQYMRINPLLDWSYHDVWTFLRKLNLPYCPLYDAGYTSLGSMNNTHPNPSLQYIDKDGVVQYKAAYQLQNGDQERDGRNI